LEYDNVHWWCYWTRGVYEVRDASWIRNDRPLDKVGFAFPRYICNIVVPLRSQDLMIHFCSVDTSIATVHRSKPLQKRIRDWSSASKKQTTQSTLILSTVSTKHWRNSPSNHLRCSSTRRLGSTNTGAIRMSTSSHRPGLPSSTLYEHPFVYRKFSSTANESSSTLQPGHIGLFVTRAWCTAY
jgi:hypothetical protein